LSVGKNGLSQVSSSSVQVNLYHVMMWLYSYNLDQNPADLNSL